MTHDEALKSPLGKYLLKYCYCSSDVPGGAPSSDTCRIHYALAGIDPVLKEMGLRDQVMREALRSIAASCQDVGEDISHIWVRGVADAALAEKTAGDGLHLGEARNLPHPKPISDDDAKKGKCPYNHSDHKSAGFLPPQNCPNCA